MRTFISVEVPEETRKIVGDYITVLNGLFDNVVKWVLPANLHFTIKFLGEVHKSAMGMVEECVSSATSDFSQFTLTLSNIGFFPSERRPKVIWIGTDGGVGKLLNVYQFLETCLEHEGFDRDSKTFTPHLTIGRVRRDKILVLPENIPDFEPVMFEARGLAFMKSTLTPHGPVYDQLFKSDFKRKL